MGSFKTDRPLRVVFMGTPEIAVPPFEALIAAGHRVVLAVTQPDRPKGRGGKLAAPPVRLAAEAHGIPVAQPERVRRDEGFARQLKELAPDVAVVIAFGQILPQAILDIPRFGCINIHASLLPRYRGAAPINWAIANGDKETGLATMRMDAGLDTGPTYLEAVTPIHRDDDAVSLAARLAGMAGPLIVATLERVQDGMRPAPQDDARATLAPILRKEDGEIDWRRPARDIVNRLRAFVPWPGSFTSCRGERWKVIAAQAGDGPLRGAAPGTVARVDGDSILVAAGEGGVRITELQVPGKRAMSVRDFLNGRPVQKGEVLGG
ncbi:MAG: methionyl-tRNA formyltransferase [Nitrospirae bacterium]|nr:methionyl-tRNA formyltransferase [Nitrospirota bacterium]